jgi:hypothetical protein
MRAALRLEEFGSSAYMGFDQSGPWVARILGFDDQYGYKREFARFHRDYSGASSTGNRGIWRHYALEPGVYEVNRRLSWKHVRREFLFVDDDGSLCEISREDVEAWLRSACSELTS